MRFSFIKYYSDKYEFNKYYIKKYFYSQGFYKPPRPSEKRLCHRYRILVTEKEIIRFVNRVLGSSMATQECAPAPVRSALFRSHDWHGRSAGAFGGVHRSLPHWQHGQRLGQAGQSVGRPPPPLVVLLDARAAVVVHAALVYCSRSARRQAHDRGQTHSGRSNIHG